jgi:hypothetical protein
MLDANHIPPVADHVYESDQHPGGVCANRTFGLHSITPGHPGLDCIPRLDGHTSDRPLSLSNFELPEPGRLISLQAALEGLSLPGSSRSCPKGCGERRPTVRTSLLQDRVGQLRPDQGLHLPPDAPKSGLYIQHGHARSAKLQKPWRRF